MVEQRKRIDDGDDRNCSYRPDDVDTLSASISLSLFSLLARSLPFFRLPCSFCSSVPPSPFLTPSTYNLLEPFSLFTKSKSISLAPSIFLPSFLPFFSHPLHKHTHTQQKNSPTNNPRQLPSTATRKSSSQDDEEDETPSPNTHTHSTRRPRLDFFLQHFILLLSFHTIGTISRNRIMVRGF